MPIGAPDWGTLGIFGRVLAGPDYSTGTTMVYRSHRVVTRSKFVLLTTSSKFGLFSSSDDEAPSASVTNNTTITDLSPALDHNDDTSADGQVTVPAGSCTDALIFDFGSVSERYVIVKFSTPGAVPDKYVMVSDDGTTWTQIAHSSDVSLDFSGLASFRYLALRVCTSSDSDITYNISVYTVEAYTPNNRTQLNYYTSGEDTITAFVTDGGYWLYEVIYEVIPGWG